jgi:MFS transporter, BCD family, chlorophyll transporter
MGAWVAIAGFLAIAGSGLVHQVAVFYTGVVLLGLGTGLSTVSNLSLMLDMTTARVGLYIGAWGLADALARLVGTVMSGVVRDVFAFLTRNALLGYITVFVIEAVMLGISIYLLNRIDVQSFRGQAQTSAAERAALMNEASG